MGVCRGDQVWPGAEIGLSPYSLKFADRLEELGYAQSCSARLKGNLFVSMCIACIVSLGMMSPDHLSPDRQVRWPKHATLGFIFISSLCYIIVHLVPSFSKHTSMFGREVFGVLLAAAAICTPRQYYLTDIRLEDQLEELNTLSDAQSVIIAVMILTATHMLIPVRFYLLIALEMHIVLWHPFWIVVAVSRTGYVTWYLHILLCILVFCFFLGKRHAECTERYLFKKFLAEKVLRVTTESRLDKLEQTPRIMAPDAQTERSLPQSLQPSTIGTAIAFDLKGPGTADEHFRRMATIGQKEHWLLRGEGLRLFPHKSFGKGGFGSVVAADYYGTPVAVKRPHFSFELDKIGSLCNELRILRYIRHPNIVLFFGALINFERHQMDIVLEQVAGETLDAFVSGGKCECTSLSSNGDASRFQILLGVCRALRHLHALAMEIVHGDIKGSNIMVEVTKGTVRPKLLDFGLSRLLARDAKPLGGTLRWKAPELVDKVPKVMPSADVFSFGHVVYFVATGTGPFNGVSDAKEVKAMLKAGRLPAMSFHGPFAQLAQGLVETCLSIAPEGRPSMQGAYTELWTWPERLLLPESVGFDAYIPSLSTIAASTGPATSTAPLSAPPEFHWSTESDDSTTPAYPVGALDVSIP